MLYQVAGLLNAITILASLSGVWAQFAKIRERKRDPGAGRPTEILSLNQFTVSLFAFWSFFVYGYSIEPFNHYLVWPRLVGCFLVLAILYEIYADRRTRASRVVFFCGSALLALGICGLLLGRSFKDEGRLASTSLIVAVSLLLAQAYWHQIGLIWRSGKTGALSLRMNQTILAMDCSTIFFALTMGLAAGWPLLMLALVSGSTKLVVLWLFRWTRLSPEAERRRALSAAQGFTPA
ncbi:MAG TPA: hypothetical protein VFB01_03465 [Burkholderiales bacterium]|nr:hypothetical protein [Burkholderiales bacterium]